MDGVRRPRTGAVAIRSSRILFDSGGSTHDGQLYYNPGIPAVLDFDVQAITDVASRYDIDGIHFDDYF